MYEDSGGRAAPVLADRYRLIAQLGRGGTARVLRAWDERLDREVAVKVFQPHADPVGRLRFDDEAKLLAGFDHPRLVKVFDSGVANGEPYLVLELINGPQLGRRIDQGPMSPDEVRDLGIALAEALAYVHSRGVVHRDIKPGNVLLSADGKPHLADFGLAKLLARSGITASDRLVGTAAYLSPEQVLGTEVGPPTDIYGLGLVLLECLTREIEYPGLGAETVLARLNRQPRIPDDLPGGLAAALEAMTQSDPAERPSAAECAELLASDQPTVPIARPHRFFHGRAAVVLGAGLVAAAVGLMLAVPVSDGTQRGPGGVQPDHGVLPSSNVNSVATTNSRQSTGGQHPRPTADQRQATRESQTVAPTPQPTSAPPPAVAGQPKQPTDPLDEDASSKSKKPKKTKKKDKPKDKNSD